MIIFLRVFEKTRLIFESIVYGHNFVFPAILVSLLYAYMFLVLFGRVSVLMLLHVYGE